MIFKPITLADKEIIQAFTLNGTNNNCDLSFANLCSWCFLYGTEYDVYNGWLVLRFTSDEHLFYMMPLGSGDLCTIIDAMEADARSLNHALCILGISESMRAMIEETLPDRFHFSYSRDYADYIYLREDLVTLRGKKLQPKRNHVNKFLRLYPNYRFEPLTTAHVPECLSFEKLWESANQTPEEITSLEAERRSMTFALEHFDELDLRGGILTVDGKMCAFTYGAPINADTFDVCFEKADINFEGSYAMINNAFAKTIPEQYTYINREEDLGLEGLRRAKLSYQPHKLLLKYAATIHVDK